MLVADEPGIGKSRLAAELEKRLHAEPHLRLRYFCSPYDHESALYPVVRPVERRGLQTTIGLRYDWKSSLPCC